MNCLIRAFFFLKEGVMSFEELLRKLGPKMRAIAHRLDGKYTAFSDQDLYQEALFYLWQQYQTQQVENKTDSYLLQGCYFYLKNYIRTVHKTLDRHSVSINAKNQEGDELEAILPPLEEKDVLEEIDSALIVDDIERFCNAREREILRLRLQECTTRYIGRKLGISHVMVTKMEKKIREKVKNLRYEIIVH
jgi:RNA polymerase sigma factor (sigma-70 family)